LAKNLTSNRHYTYCPEKCDRPPQEIVAGFAQETAIRRTAEAFIGPNAALLAGQGFENRYAVQRWSEQMACNSTWECRTTSQ
jgi:hypothetical protein